MAPAKKAVRVRERASEATAAAPTRALRPAAGTATTVRLLHVIT